MDLNVSVTNECTMSVGHKVYQQLLLIARARQEGSSRVMTEEEHLRLHAPFKNVTV